MSEVYSGFTKSKAWWELKKGPFSFIVWKDYHNGGYEVLMFYGGKLNKKGGYETIEDACRESLERAIKGTEMLLNDLKLLQKDSKDE